MQYEKKIMKATDLYRMGIPRSVIQCAIEEKKEFVRKANPTKTNSTILVDTEEFDKWWVRRNTAVRRAMNG